MGTPVLVRALRTIAVQPRQQELSKRIDGTPGLFPRNTDKESRPQLSQVGVV